MENNKYAGCFLLREIKGVNLFFSLVSGKKLNSVEFTSRGKKKNNEKYYLVCKFANEFYKGGSASSDDLQFIQELEKKEFVIKDAYTAAKKWFYKNCQISKVCIRVSVEKIIENKHLCFSGSKVFFKASITHENMSLNNFFYYEKEGDYICNNKGVLLT